MAVDMTKNYAYGDEYWQGTEVAYGIVYGNVDLPWEWTPDYRIRCVLYPYFLALPLWIVKTLGLDGTWWITRLAPYLAHMILVLLSDAFFFKLAKKILGTRAAKISFIIYFTNSYFNRFIIRCFANSVESTIHLVVFYYFYDITSRFDKNLTIVAFALALATSIRNTSIIGWIPLLLVKMFQKGAIIPFIMTGVLVALPTLGLVVMMDSIYYGQFTVTAFNFFKVNVFKNLSAEFGVHKPLTYFNEFLPEALGWQYLLLVISAYSFGMASWRKR